jgi:hypothetical protein
VKLEGEGKLPSTPILASARRGSCGSRRTFRVGIEIVDTPEQIDRVVPILDEMAGEGMLTVERVQIVSYRSSGE